MGQRKAIPKSIRFEVFKRDSFVCQYCGRAAPEVILECDHIIPVAEGGSNELLNLVTACRDCNRGKGKRLLTNNQSIEKQKRQLDELNERREQMEMLVKWKKELLKLDEEQVSAVEDLVFNTYGRSLTTHGRRNISKLIKRFGLNEVVEAAEIAFERYYKGNDASAQKAMDKIGGVCYNREKQRAEQEW